MRTLVYFASGPLREEYHDLDFDKIYLIDNCFRSRNRIPENLSQNDKITCMGMDCLKSIEFLKQKNVKIDCFVSLNEGLYEVGGSYPINSDMFLGYAMPIFKDRYIHIMNKNYYSNGYHVNMDLPYSMDEIKESDSNYISPFIFSKSDYHKGHAKVFQMEKMSSINKTISISLFVKVNIIYDSIWNYTSDLEAIVISFLEQGQRNFFEQIPNVLNMNLMDLDAILDYCKLNNIENIGFTPLTRVNYENFFKKIITYSKNRPLNVHLFHLNKNQYQEL